MTFIQNWSPETTSETTSEATYENIGCNTEPPERTGNWIVLRAIRNIRKTTFLWYCVVGVSDMSFIDSNRIRKGLWGQRGS